MAQFYLDRDAKSELGYSSTAVTVNGTAGDQDRILLRSNAANVTVGAAVEIVDFYGDSADYAFVNEGGRVALYRGEILVARVASNDKTTELRFADGALSMAQDTETGALTVGGQQVTNEKAAYAGDELNTDHKSEAGGGSGPVPGKGEEYFLPEDLGAGNVIQSGTGNDTYTATTVNGLKKDAQIVDGSPADNDTLTMTYDLLNQNGSIINVENIDATWTGYSNATFNAEDVTHARGTNITIANGHAAFSDATVSNVQNHHVIAGANVTGTLTVENADDGAQVTAGKAKTVVIADPESNVSVTVNADSSFVLDASGPGTSFFDQDRESVIRINASKDIVVAAGDGLKDGTSQALANIVSVGEGRVALDAGKLVSGDDISRLDTGITVRADLSGLAAGDDITVADGQRLQLARTTSKVIEFITWVDPERPDYDDVDGMNLCSLHLDLSAANTYAGFDITDIDLGKLYLNVTKDTTIEAVSGSGYDAADPDIPADAFIFTGAGNAIVVDVNSAVVADNGVSIISDSTHTGHLTVGDVNGNSFKHGSAVGGKGGLTVYASVDAGTNNEVSVVGGTGADELFVEAAAQNGSIAFAGGDGKDSVKFSDTGTAATTVANGSTVVLNMGAGDDTVTICELADTTTGVVASGGSLAIDFGDGKDTLTIDGTKGTAAANTGVNFTVAGANVKISGMEVLDITGMTLITATIGKGLIVNQDTFDSWNFQLKGDGLTVKLGGGNFSTAGITTDRAQYKVTLDGSGSLATGTTITLNDSLNETLDLGAGSKYHTLENFTAKNEDTIRFGGNNAITFQNSSITKVSTDDYATVDAYILSLDRDNIAGGKNFAYVFEYASDTYVVSLAADDGLHAELGKDDYAVRLAGAGYAYADLAASITV